MKLINTTSFKKMSFQKFGPVAPNLQNTILMTSYEINQYHKFNPGRLDFTHPQMLKQQYKTLSYFSKQSRLINNVSICLIDTHIMCCSNRSLIRVGPKKPGLNIRPRPPTNFLQCRLQCRLSARPVTWDFPHPCLTLGC